MTDTTIISCGAAFHIEGRGVAVTIMMSLIGIIIFLIDPSPDDHMAVVSIIVTSLGCLLGFTLLSSSRTLGNNSIRRRSSVQDTVSKGDLCDQEMQSLLTKAINDFVLLFNALEKSNRMLDGYEGFSGMLCAHLNNVNGCTEDAATTIISRLQQIDQTVVEMIEFINDSMASEKALMMVHQTEELLEQNRRKLVQFSEQKKQDEIRSAENIKKIQEMTNGLSETAQLVRNIAYQTKMLALNAAIEARRVGDVGSGFSVISTEIKNLAQSSDQAAQLIKSNILEIKETITCGIKFFIEERLESERLWLEKMMGDITHLTDHLEKILSHQQDVISKVHNSNQFVEKLIVEAIGTIQFQDISRQQIEEVIASIKDSNHLVSNLQIFLRDASLSQDVVSIKDLIDGSRKRLVMNIQRHICSQTTGEACDAGLSIELF
ncbi:methyl-accepting chemotaxis protein [Azospirillaceae bacterium]